MSNRVSVTYICDLDGKHEGPVETRTFIAPDGTLFEIEACTRHNASLVAAQERVVKALAPFTSVGRKASTGTVSHGLAKKRTDRNRGRSSGIRAWAKTQGMDVSARGRISREVEQQYAAAH